MSSSSTPKLNVDLPVDVFPIAGFLAIHMYYYVNKKTGKKIYTNIGFGKYSLKMNGTQIELDPNTGKPAVAPPDFIYKMTFEEMREMAQKLPFLVQSMDLANQFGWSTKEIVNQTKDSITYSTANKENIDPFIATEPHSSISASSSTGWSPVSPTLWQNAAIATSPSPSPWSNGTGNSGFGLPECTSPWAMQ